MAMSDMTIVRRSLLARPLATVTTLITVSVAVALMLVLLSLRDAANRAFERGGGNMHLLISRDASPLVAVLNGVFYAGAPRAAIEWAKYEQIAQSQPWEFAIPTVLGDSYRGLPVMGTTTEFFTKFEPQIGAPWRAAQGRFFERSLEVVVGAEAARLAGLRLGQQISLSHGMAGVGTHDHDEYQFEIVGILSPTNTPHDRALFISVVDSWIVHAHDRRVLQLGHDIALTTEADLEPRDRLITGIYCRVMTRPGAQVTAAIQSIFDQLRRDGTLTVASPADQAARLRQIIGNIDGILLGMAAVVLISSGVAIMLAMISSTELRRRQIAVLRVLGASQGRIFNLVMAESAMLGLAGAVAGILLSVFGTGIVGRVLEGRIGVSIDATPSLEWIIVITAGSALLAALAGLAPAVRAYQTSVIRNLRPLG